MKYSILLPASIPTKLPLLAGFTALSLSVYSLLASAEAVTLVGDTINYQYDDVANAGALAVFGTPVIIGDSVRFLPPSFRTESIDGNGTGLLSANFIFSDVYSRNGQAIKKIEVVDFGDYKITDGGSVSADLLLTISSNRSILDFDSNSSSFDFSGDSSGLQTWGISAAVDPSLSFNGLADNVAVSLQNTLEASTDAEGETAWIQKKLVFAATASEVPVPSALWLFGSALMGMGIVGRRQ
jgi:hypothetical protein